MSRIPTSGVMTWTDVQNSFGGSNPIGINETVLVVQREHLVVGALVVKFPQMDLKRGPMVLI